MKEDKGSSLGEFFFYEVSIFPNKFKTVSAYKRL